MEVAAIATIYRRCSIVVAFVAMIGASLLSCSCVAVRHIRPLHDVEREGIDELLESMDAYAAASPDPKPGAVCRALRAKLAADDVRVGDIEGTPLGCVSLRSGRMYLDSRVSYKPWRLDGPLEDRITALSVLYHEAVHLTQLGRDLSLEAMEDEAYHETHRLQVWLVDRVARTGRAPGFRPVLRRRFFEAMLAVRQTIDRRAGAHTPWGRLFAADVGNDAPVRICGPVTWVEADARPDGTLDVDVRLALPFAPGIERGFQTRIRHRPDFGTGPTWSYGRFFEKAVASTVHVGWLYAEGPDGPVDPDRWNDGPTRARLVELADDRATVRLAVGRPGRWRLALKPAIYLTLGDADEAPAKRAE